MDEQIPEPKVNRGSLQNVKDRIKRLKDSRAINGIRNSKHIHRIGRIKDIRNLRKIKDIRIDKEKIRTNVRRARQKVSHMKPILLVDGLTLSNAMFGFLSMLSSIYGQYTDACIFLLLAALMDFLDGKVARRLSRTSDLGRELDSLSDVISFGVAPAVLGFVYIRTMLIIPFLLAFLACGIIRLAKFNVQGTKGVYYGMPITTNAFIFPIVFFAGLPIGYWPMVYAASAVLMVSPFRLRKLL